MTIANNSSPNVEPMLWYKHPQTVNRWFNGVFEGGGAKGVAYAGALKAMRDRKCWFKSVAGSSAGSITAALVASGHEPEKIETMAETALKTVRQRPWLARRTLRAGYGYFNKYYLTQWIKDKLKYQMKVLGAPSEDPNFRELFDLTGIELNVIATSLSLKSLVVFSYHDTPNCSVAEAVAASAAIPIAFGDSLLELKDTDGTTWHQTIVDGGVWANFPWFVYTDHNFRKHYERTDEISPKDIIGFVLDESRSYQFDDDEYYADTARNLLRGSHVKFSDTVKVNPYERRPGRTFRREKARLGRVNPWEKRPGRTSDQGKAASESPPWLIFQAVRLLALLGKMVSDAEAKEVTPDRWPEPNSLFHKHIVGAISGLFQGLTGPLSLIASLFVSISILYMFVSITALVFPWWWSTLPFSIWGVFVKFMIFGLWLMFFLLILLFVEAVFFLFMTARFLNESLRRIGYGLVTTYVSGSGAPEWMCEDDRIIFLPVAGVRTTDFDMKPENRTKLIERAEKETNLKLTSLGVPTQKK